jgi:ProP effector
MAEKAVTPYSASQSAPSYSSKTSNQTSASEDYLPTYPVRSYATQNAPVQPARSAAVVVKHKTTRQYDPSAVARLKEKLGLSRNLEEKKEAVKS